MNAPAFPIQLMLLTMASPTPQKKNRIQVSNTKKPLFFYVNLAKRYMQQHNLGMEVLTSTIGMKDENRGRLVQKAETLGIVLEKLDKFDNLVVARAAARTGSEPAACDDQKK